VTIGVSIFLIAVGAILKWAVTAHVSWINIQTAGTIIFVVGLVGLVITVAYTFWWHERERTPPDQYRPPRQ
jgi:predicted tellurium resistance membrane protein TerC